MDIVERLRSWDHCWPADWLEYAVEEAAAEIERLRAERDFARDVIAKCAQSLGNGAFIGKDCSDDFRALLPSEIGLHVASLTEDRDTWTEQANEAEARADTAERKVDRLREVLAPLIRAKPVGCGDGDTFTIEPLTAEMLNNAFAAINETGPDDTSVTNHHAEIAAERDRLKAERDYWERARNEWEKACDIVQEENKTLRKALRVAREALISIEEYWNRSETDGAMSDACWNAVNTAAAAITRIDQLIGEKSDD